MPAPATPPQAVDLSSDPPGNRAAWLDHAHRALDEAVADAYGQGEEYRAGTLSDDEVLVRLFALNQARLGNVTPD